MDFLITPYVEIIMKYNIPLSGAFLIWHIIGFVLIVLLLVVTVSLWTSLKKIFVCKILGKKSVSLWYEYLKIFVNSFRLFKTEDITPYKSDKFLFWSAPVIVLTAAVFEWCVIPFASNFQAIKSDMGVFLFLTIFLVFTFGKMLAGIAAKNNFSLFGAKRICLQLTAVFIPLLFSVMSVVLLAGSMNLQTIIAKQSAYGLLSWYIIPSLIGFLVFFTAMLGLVNLSPFDYDSSESEIVGGYKTEFSGIKYLMLNSANNATTLIFAVFCAVLFLGGYMPPFHFFIADAFAHSKILYGLILTLEQLFWLFLKAYLLLFFVLVLNFISFRLRCDKFALVGWKYLIPLSFINLLLICLIKQGGFYA